MHNRRQFLRNTMALPLLAGGNTLLGNLASFQAHAADTEGYRALVCVFLFGGMDCHDTVLPFDTASYNQFVTARKTLMSTYDALPQGSSRAQNQLLALETASNPFGDRQFALPPQMNGLHSLFQQGKAAIVGNVGPLLEPTNRTTFNNRSAELPKRLFSHNDQQSTWLSFAPEGAQVGWGGRFGDAVSGANTEAVFSQISLFGNTVFLTGNSVGPYQIGTDGVPTIRVVKAAPAGVSGMLRDHFASVGSTRQSLFEQDFIDISRVSLDANDKLALATENPLDTPFPASSLGSQLRAVAKTIGSRQAIGAKRQVYFVGLGGFDTHSNQAQALPGLQQTLSDAMTAFYNATEELGVADQVTTFTAADFGRTLTANGDGTDHGWGGHHFVVGGAVRGGNIYGDIPIAQLGHNQDAGNGRLIPTASVEQFAAPLGQWFGLNNQELATALPGLASFPNGALGYI